MLVEGNIISVRLALLSSYEKEGLVDFAHFLNQAGTRLLSTGGTAAQLKEANIPVLQVSDLTHFPEIMGGRLKTLHPLIHGGLLARPNLVEDRQAMETHGIRKIDLVYVTLYPFEKAIASGATVDECIENIDIGGPAMIRSAAKNHHHTAVVVDPEDMLLVQEDIKKYKGITFETRRKLAAKAFARTAFYDAVIARWFATQQGELTYLKWFTEPALLKQHLRYGENNHQTAAVYQTPETGSSSERDACIIGAKQVQGKNLSYNNINDADAALDLISEFNDDPDPVCAIIKHTNPCGVSAGKDTLEAYTKALACDPVSAFGSIVVFNQPIDEKTTKKILDIFVEIVIVPDASPQIVDLFAKKPNVRLLILKNFPDPRRKKLLLRSISGGLLVQSRDNAHIKRGDLRVVTKRAPTGSEVDDMIFALRVAKHVRSNAILYVSGKQTLGIGAGQMSRIDATKIAISKAQGSLSGSVMASDAFFPFPDSVLEASAQGCSAIIQPGGSIRDAEVIEAANNEGLAMVFTGTRHFRH